jgi:hypothetical protein
MDPDKQKWLSHVEPCQPGGAFTSYGLAPSQEADLDQAMLVNA